MSRVYYIEDIKKAGILFKNIIPDDIKKELLRYRVTWKTMTPKDVWKKIIEERCVWGGTTLIDNLKEKKKYEDFLEKMSIETILKLPSGKRKDHLKRLLRKATRFYPDAAEFLLECLENQDIFRNGKLVLFDDLKEGMDEDDMRGKLLERIPLFKMKSISDFMIDIGMAKNLMAFDTRVVGFLCKYFGLTVKRKDGKDNIKNVKETIQDDKELYKALEGTLRDHCQEIGIPLSLLDRLIFRYGNDKIVEDLMAYSNSS